MIQFVRDSFDRGVENPHHGVDLLVGDDEGRTHGKDITAQRPEDDAILEGFQPDLAGDADGWIELFFALLVANEFHPGEEAKPTDIPDDRVLLELSKLG